MRLSGRFDLPAYPGFMVTKMAMSGFTFTVFPTSSTVIGFAPGVSREGGERRERGERRGRREERERARDDRGRGRWWDRKDEWRENRKGKGEGGGMN